MDRLSHFFRQRGLYLDSALVTLSTAIIYLSVAPSRLTDANFGSDGGDLLSAVLTLGIPHPTGYPTYTLLGTLFQLIPLSTPVFRAVLGSLLPTALAAGLLTAWMGYVIGSIDFPTLAVSALVGLCWGVAPILFSQAVIVEIHGLQALIVVLVLWWITLNLEYTHGVHQKWLLGLSFFVGLGVGNHLTILFLFPAVLLALVCLVYRSRPWHLLLAEISLVILGMLVYLYLPLRAQAYPPINWGNPQSWQGFLWEVGAEPYRGFLFSASTAELWEKVRSVLGLLLDQFGALGMLAGVFGVIIYPFRNVRLRFTLVWIFFAFLVFTVFYNSKDSLAYIIPAIMVFAVWVGVACNSLLHLIWKKYPLGMLLSALIAVSILVRIPQTRHRLDPRLQDQPARYAEQLFKVAPLNAIIYTTSDQDSFPLWYYHFGLRERPDLHIVVLPLTQFVWYQQTLVHTYPLLRFPAVYAQDLPNADWGIQIAQLNPDLPVCSTQLSAESETGISYQCGNP
jgi:Protein O-mannosyl-transferase TMEM260-like